MNTNRSTTRSARAALQKLGVRVPKHVELRVETRDPKALPVFPPSTIPLKSLILEAAKKVDQARMPKYYWILLTPELATFLLGTMVRQRHIRWGEIRKLIERLKKGEWDVTHEPLAISVSGLTQDGMHRCLAVYLSGVAAMIAVAVDVPDAALKTMGQGSIRQGHDRMQMAYGETEARHVSTWANSFYSLTRRGWRSQGIDYLKAWADANREAVQWGKQILSICPTKFYKKQAIMSALVIAHATNPRRVAELVHDLMMGTNLRPGSALLALSRYLAHQQTLRTYDKGRDNSRVMSTKVLTALRAALRNEALDAVEADPEAVGFFARKCREPKGTKAN